jgi:NAD(P)-dependent dehydrogenase (short-subunit alcohol dehydrogenase family)
MQGFHDEVAVITGAGSGIGRALALDLARAGARLAVSDVDAVAAEATATRCREVGALAKAHHLDVADRAAVESHAGDVEDEHGRVDLVINNAGVALAARAVQQRVEDVDHVLDVNLRGVVHGTQAFLPALHRAPAGRLVNISSVFGLVPMPLNSAYNASKFGVRGYTEALAIELELAGSSVRTTCVHPGGVATAIASSARTAPGNEEIVAGFQPLLRMPPERAARIILRGVARGRRRVLVGQDAWALHLGYAVLGHRFQRVVARVARPYLGATSDEPV